MADAGSGGAPASVRLGRADVLVGRAAEQAVLAGGSLYLASRLGPEDFAPVGVVLVAGTLAVTLADLGLGVRVLRVASAQQVDLASRRLVRLVNAGVAVLALAVALLVTGDIREVVLVSGLLWGLAAEATTRKAAALRLGASRRVAVAETAGAGLVALGIVLAAHHPDSAVMWAGGGLAAKQALEIVLAGAGGWAFGDAPPDRDRMGVWLAQALAYAIANVDYLVVGMVLGREALAVYLLAFRLANAVPSQMSFVVARIATVDLASGAPERRQRSYERYTCALFLAGWLGAAVTIAASPLVEALLGDQWDGLAWTLTVLVLAAPWRAVLGTAGTLVILSGAADRLVRWEAVRLVVTVTALAGAAAAGYGWLLATSVAMAVASVLAYHPRAGRLAGVRAWRPLSPAAGGTAALLAVFLVAGWSALDGLR